MTCTHYACSKGLPAWQLPTGNGQPSGTTFRANLCAWDDVSLGLELLYRLTGLCIHLPCRFSDLHGFEKPNDLRALTLMDDAAKEVLREFPDVRIAFGQSDEYSFVLHKDTSIYGEAKQDRRCMTTWLSFGLIRYLKSHSVSRTGAYQPSKVSAS